MALTQAQRYCRICDRKTLHARQTFSTGWGCLLTLLTGGLFLIIWIPVMFLEALTSKWRCQACGQGRLL